MGTKVPSREQNSADTPQHDWAVRWCDLEKTPHFYAGPPKCPMT
jgi:hypothetical protein